jgi:hypothetical protein
VATVCDGAHAPGRRAGFCQDSKSGQRKVTGNYRGLPWLAWRGAKLALSL